VCSTKRELTERDAGLLDMTEVGTGKEDPKGLLGDAAQCHGLLERSLCPQDAVLGVLDFPQTLFTRDRPTPLSLNLDDCLVNSLISATNHKAQTGRLQVDDGVVDFLEVGLLSPEALAKEGGPLQVDERYASFPCADSSAEANLGDFHVFHERQVLGATR